MGKREDIWDFMKGVGMILVVLGHSNFRYNDIIYLFHVPLFFIISGFFFKKSGTIFYSVLKKMKRLYIPNFQYGFFFLIIHNILVVCYFCDTFYTFKDYIRQFVKIVFMGNEQLGGGMWFLRTLLFTYCLYVLYSLLSRKLVKILFVSFIISIGWFCIDIECLFIFRTALTIPCIVFPFILWGHCLNNYRFLFEMRYFHFFLMLILCFFLLYIVSQKCSFDVVNLKISNLLLYYIMGVVGFFFSFSIGKIMERTSFYKPVVFIGNNTIPILALHFFSFKIFTLIYIIIIGGDWSLLSDFPVPRFSDNILLPILYTIMGLFFPILFVHFRHKILSLMRLKL